MNVIQSLTRPFRQFVPTLQRHYVTTVWLTLFTLWCLNLSENWVEYREEIDVHITLTLLLGTLFSLLARLMTEGQSERKHLLWSGGLYAFLAAFILWLHAQPWHWTVLEASPIIAVCILTVIAIVCLPRWRVRTDTPVWRFLVRIVTGLAVGGLTAGLLSTCIVSLHLFIVSLFGLGEPRGTTIGDYLIIIWSWFFPLVVLQFLPTRQTSDTEENSFSPSLTYHIVIWTLLFTIACYLLTLYVYLLKIVVTWTLPQGMVSWPVIILMLLMLALHTMLHPLPAEQMLRKRVYQLWPLLMLPNLALMTVAVGRRLSDYGISLPRLYLVCLLLWFFVMIVIALWPRFRLRFISLSLVSLGLITLLSSVGPWSIANMVYRSFRSDVETQLTIRGVAPRKLTVKQMTQRLNQLPKDEALSLVTKLNVLAESYDHRGVEQWLSQEAWEKLWKWEVSLKNNEDVNDNLVINYSLGTSLSSLNNECSIALPEGCRLIEPIDKEVVVLQKDSTVLILSIPRNNNQQITMRFDLRKGKKLLAKDYENNPYTLYTAQQGKEVMYLIEKEKYLQKFIESKQKKVQINALLFTK